MKTWVKPLAGSVLVLVFALALGGFVMLLRAQQGNLAATMAAAHIRAVSPPDGATNVPVTGDIRADYASKPAQDPSIKLEPVAGVALSAGQWDGSTFSVHYAGLRENSLYHAELAQDDSTQSGGGQNDVKQTDEHKKDDSAPKGEHKQIKVRWSFRTGTVQHVVPSASPTLAVPSISVSPSRAPSPSPSASGPLIWYRGPSNDLHSVDWTGKPVKNLSPDIMIQSPDGSLLWRRPNTPGGTSAVTDADGNPVGSVPVDQNMMWADDSRQFCGVTSTPAGSYELEMLRINGTRDRVGAIRLTPGTNQVPVLAACSVLTRRAVLIGQSSGYTWSVSMIALSDGSVLFQQSYPNPLARIVASHDGQYIVEQYPTSGNVGPAIQIRELPSGTSVGQFAGIVVQGFSWDGSLVIGSTFGNPTVQEAQVYRWRTHETVWRQCMCPHPHGLSVLPQPGSSKLAVVASTDDGAHVSFTIVDANGTSRSVPISSTPIYPAF